MAFTTRQVVCVVLLLCQLTYSYEFGNGLFKNAAKQIGRTWFLPETNEIHPNSNKKMKDSMFENEISNDGLSNDDDNDDENDYDTEENLFPAMRKKSDKNEIWTEAKRTGIAIEKYTCHMCHLMVEDVKLTDGSIAKKSYCATLIDLGYQMPATASYPRFETPHCRLETVIHTKDVFMQYCVAQVVGSKSIGPTLNEACPRKHH